jgi:hypothetical protein
LFLSILLKPNIVFTTDYSFLL